MQSTQPFAGHSNHRRKVSTFVRNHTNPHNFRAKLERWREGLPGLKKKIPNLFTFVNALRLIWILTVLWYERGYMRNMVANCQWGAWEQWPENATPARVAIVTDPQLIDPHTYDRRGISLRATMYYSDLYMRRAWNLIQDNLVPEATFMLGDLFDGGREWGGSMATSQHLEDPKAASDWKDYKGDYWWHEFKRFEKIFTPREGRKIYRSIPGNHDLGLGNGIDQTIYDRFKTIFGMANEEVYIGNHSFVMLDSVSLSNTVNHKINAPSKDFLTKLAEGPAKLPREPSPFTHKVATSKDAKEVVLARPAEVIPDREIPRILLTHVPLYRQPHTDCGPLRESPNPISIVAGFQYQNVLASSLSTEILQATKPILVLAGDDHDYCEIFHKEVSPKVREITVKSISWTMGVRHPGFLLLSAWNPAGKTFNDADTVQTHLCLLPDQIGIFLTYASMLGGTLLIVLLRALFWKIRPISLSSPASPSSPILPTYAVLPKPSTTTSTTLVSASSTTSTYSYGGYGLPPTPGLPQTQQQLIQKNREDDDNKYNKNKTVNGPLPQRLVQNVRNGWTEKWKGTRGGRAVEEVYGTAVVVLGFYAILVFIMG